MQACEILLVEDNPADVLLIQEAFKEARIGNRISVARDGEEAIQYLRREGSFAEAVRPDLLLLDLHLPKRSGGEVLSEIKNDPELAEIPVIILTTSSEDEDIHQAYRLHANCYLTKPVDIDSFLALVCGIDQFWLTLVKLPTQRRASAGA
jgi:two-component system, chemotaxis family, response regulator Rcp1